MSVRFRGKTIDIDATTLGGESGAGQYRLPCKGET
jgi:hypothetical protein